MCLRTAFIVWLACAGMATAADRPHWAGPKGDCTTDEKGLLKEWPKEGPTVLWRIRVGTGSNHPSVAGDDLCFAQLDDDSRHEIVKCVDANTGKEKWSHTYEVPPVYSVGRGKLGVRATPTITDQYVRNVRSSCAGPFLLRSVGSQSRRNALKKCRLGRRSPARFGLLFQA